MEVVNSMTVFEHNEFKSFNFTPEQYLQLEIEYTRFLLYKDLMKNIETVLKLNDAGDYNMSNTQRKIYENKNITDRFILECINNGITPNLGNDITYKSVRGDHGDPVDQVDHVDQVDMDKLKCCLLFNESLISVEKLRATVYFQKMVSEYAEKKIKITPDRLIKLENTIIDANKQFQTKVNLLIQNKNKPNIFNDIQCSIGLTGADNYIIRYRTYTKMINLNRYTRLVKSAEQSFPYDIIRMILRYTMFDMSNQQWSIGNNLYENISQLLDISFEMFASPLNFNMNMFCSLFLDTDKTFGSVGSFYNLNIGDLIKQNIKGVFYNPPYLPILMANTTKICMNMLSEMDKREIDFSVVSFLPAWMDADYIQQFIGCRYTMFHKIINRGDYVLHEKDKGKIIRGMFDLVIIVMNSRKLAMNPERIESLTTSFKKIITMMKDETRTGAIDK